MLKITLSPEVTAKISQTKDGNIDKRFENSKTVDQSINKICKANNFESKNIIQMEQVHKTKVVVVDKSHQGKVICEADGLITSDLDVVLMLRIADCIPIFIFDPKKNVIALVHSGWRGTLGKIILVAIQKMSQKFGSQASDLLIKFGPSILKCCNFHTEPPIQNQLPEWQPFIKKINNKFYVDLSGFVKNSAIEVGVKRENIQTSNICTVQNKKYFSHTRSQINHQSEGRFAAFMRINKLQHGFN